MRAPIGTLLLLAALAGSARAATITIVNVDDPGEGFNDPTPVAPVGGNPGTTIGQQRLFVFQHAAAVWGHRIPSDVVIRVDAQFSPQTCNASGAVLGGASAGSSHRDFANAPFPNTWYQQSLANRLAGFDLNPGVSDIDITFNSTLGDPGCPFCWYYGVDGNEGTCVELLPVVLHELGHGLGFATITLAGVQMPPDEGGVPGPHVYDRFLYDLTQGQHWHEMASDAQRGASSQNCQMLVWDGSCVTLKAPPRLGPKPLVRVNTPVTIAGDYEVGLATFGPALGTPGLTGNLVLAQDGMGVPTNACEPLTNGAQISGNVALVDRGGCPFVVKVKNAQDAGAIAVVVADSMPGCPPPGMSGVDPTITIPAVRVTNDDGATLKSQLLLGVNVTLTADPALDAGSRSGRVLVYTPIPFALGSSVSHWDVSAEPSLLMEPAITTGLSSDLDLTLAQFEDIGWFGVPRNCTTTDVPVASDGDGDVGLGHPRPNPTARQSAVSFRLARPEFVRLGVLDVHGRRVRTLQEGMTLPGTYTRTWDGRNDRNEDVAPGVYFFSLRTSEGVHTERVVVAR